MDGKIFLYSLPLKKMVSKIAKYKDFISTLDMDEEEVFAGSFDSAVIFADLSSLSMRIRKLHLHKVIKIINEKFLEKYATPSAPLRACPVALSLRCRSVRVI